MGKKFGESYIALVHKSMALLTMFRVIFLFTTMILKDLLNFLKITQKCIYIIHEIAYRGTAEKKSNQKELHDDNIDWLCVRGGLI